MKQLSSLLAILFLVATVHECSAEPQGRERGKRPNPGAQRRPGQGQRGPAGGAQRDPAQMVARMIKEFDKDGDQKLDATELTALFAAMRERRGGAGRPGAPAGQRPPRNAGERERDGKREAGKRAGAERKRRGGSDAESTPGGEVPKRPAAE